MDKDTALTEYPTRLLYLPRGIGRLEALGEVIHVEKEQLLVEVGQVPKYAYIVKSGRVAAYEYTAFGEERLYNFMEAGSMMLEPNLLIGLPTPVSFMAVTPSVLVRIGRNGLITAMNSDPEINRDVFESLSYKFLGAMEQIRESCTHTAPWKVCNLLLILADRYGVVKDGKIVIQEKITQKTIANLLGMNRVTVARIMKDLKNQGLIDQAAGRYRILSVEEIKRHQEEIDQAAYKTL